MRDFAYSRPSLATEALSELGPEALAMAGSTELLNWMRLGIVAPAKVVDISRLPDMSGIVRDGDHLVIGALTTLAEVGDHPLVQRHAGALGEACRKSASAQIRNRATLGGNVLQKTRCGYFRAEHPLPWGCNKREPGSGCAALDGVSDHHAIFGWTDACIATQPSDPLVALACLDAVVEMSGSEGSREIPITELHLTPSESDPIVDTRLQAEELIVRYRVPIRAGERSAYVKVRERESYAYAIVSAAASVQMDYDRIVDARVALGSVAAKPWRLVAAETELAGVPMTRDALHHAVQRSLSAARPAGDSGFKVVIAENAAVRALVLAGGAS